MERGRLYPGDIVGWTKAARGEDEDRVVLGMIGAYVETRGPLGRRPKDQYKAVTPREALYLIRPSKQQRKTWAERKARIRARKARRHSKARYL